jgi:hypothetical protein
LKGAVRTTGDYLLIALAAAVAMCCASAQEQPLSTPFTVELTCGTASTVSSQSAAALGVRALELLESSEYDSHSANWHFPLSELHQEYRRALAGEHLRLVFEQPQTIESRSGMLRVHEIIIRLAGEARDAPFPDRFVDSVFSIDDSGQVVGYALYSGMKAVELWRAIAQATEGAACRVPADLPDVPAH